MVQVIRSIVMLLGVTLTACSGGDDGGNNPGAGSPTATVAKVKITPGAVLLTSAGEIRLLSAQAFDPSGNPLPAAVTWTSSDSAIVSVDEAGTVRAAVTAGTALITATVDAVKSEPVYVYVAQPVAGAQLVSDGQIVSGPTIVDPTAEPKPDNPYEVVLRGVPSMAPGTILINTEALPVAGRVVSANPEGSDLRVRLVVVPPSQLFTDFEFKDTVDLTQGPFEIPEELVEAYDIEQNGNTFVFTPKATTSAPLTSPIFERQAFAPVGTQALPPLPPFKECEVSAGFGSGLPIPLALSAAPAFQLSINGTLEREFTSLVKKVLVRGTPTFKFTTELEIKSAFEAKVGCKVTLKRKPVRVPGWAGLFFGGDVEFGVGFEVGGKVTLFSAKVGGTAEVKSTIEAGVTCPAAADCALTGNVTADTDVKPTFETPSLNQVQFEPSVNLFGFISLEAGNADIEQLQFKAIEAKAGAELGASLTLEALQIDNTAPDGRSKYALAFKGEVGPGIKLGEFLEFLGVSNVVPLKLSFEVPLGESPNGAATADRATYLPGERVTVQVNLASASTLFPAAVGFYNVKEVVVLRKSGLLSTEVLATQTASGGQTDFTLAFDAPGLLNANDLFAFVVTRLLPLDPPKLELGPAGTSTQNPIVSLSAVPFSGAAPLTVNFTVTASDPDGGAIVNYEWDFENDGTFDQTTTLNTTSNTYNTIGTFTAKVKVTDDEGQTAEATAAVAVTGSTIPILGGYDGTQTTEDLTCPACSVDSRIARWALVGSEANNTFALISDTVSFVCSRDNCTPGFAITGGQFHAQTQTPPDQFGGVIAKTVTGTLANGRLQFVYEERIFVNSSGELLLGFRKTFDGTHLVVHVTPISVDFGTLPVGGTGTSQFVTITNAGLISVQIGVSLDLGNSPFPLVGGGSCFSGSPVSPIFGNFFLEAQSACTVAVQFKPTSQRTFTDTLRAGASRLSAVTRVSLTGVGN